MRRTDDPLDPAIAAELHELEAELGPDLRALRADLDPGFRARLDERVATGFPRAGRRWPRVRPIAILLPVGAIAATLMVIAVGLPIDRGADDAGSSGGSVLAQREDVPESGGGADATQTEAAPPAAPAERSLAAPSAQAVAPAADAAPRRRVQRAARLELTATTDDFGDVANGVVRTTQALGGYVASSQISSGESGGSASFRLRVATARLDETLRRLSALGDVASLQQDSTDITGSFSTAQERLSDARAERRALLRALGRATTPTQIASLRQRLRLTRSQIAAAKGDLNALRGRADRATIEVGVTSSGRPADEGGAWSPGDAGRDALRVLEVSAGIALIVLAVLVPLALLGVPAGLALRASRRRRREAALATG